MDKKTENPEKAETAAPDSQSPAQQRKARKRAIEAQEKARRDAKKEEQQRKEAAFKQSIKGDFIVDENGKPIRRYSLAERLLDNKILSYSIAIGFLVVCLLAVFFMPRG